MTGGIESSQTGSIDVSAMSKLVRVIGVPSICAITQKQINTTRKAKPALQTDNGNDLIPIVGMRKHYFISEW